MNTHQKVFFTCAVTLGVLASAFASSPAPTAAIDLPRVTVVAHRVAPEIAFERAMVVGHRNDVLVAKNETSSSDN